MYKLVFSLLVISINAFSTEAYRRFPSNFSEEKENLSDTVSIYDQKNGLYFTNDLEFFTTPSSIKASVLKLTSTSIFEGGNKVLYNNYYECLKKESCHYPLRKISFLKIVDNSLALQIVGYENGYAVVHDTNRKLYAKISFTLPFVIGTKKWRKYVFTQGQNSDLAIFLKGHKDFTQFLSKINECALQKSLDCLVSNSSGSLKNDLKNIILERDILENKELCKIFLIENEQNEEITGYFSKELLKKADLKNAAFWGSLAKALKLNTDDTFISFEIVEFHKYINVVIRNRVPSKMNCGNDEDLRLSIDNQSGEWKINDIITQYFEPMEPKSTAN